MRLADAPEKLRAETGPMSKQVEVGLRLSVITRPTRAEAVRAAQALVEGLDTEAEANDFIRRSDSVSMKATYALAEVEWLTSCLWTGAVRLYGATAIALVGTPEEVASALIEYKQIGVSQFILSGWPKLGEMLRFGQEVLPLIRQKEARLEG